MFFKKLKIFNLKFFKGLVWHFEKYTVLICFVYVQLGMWHCWPLKQKGSESHSAIWASHRGNVPLRPPCFWSAKSWLFFFFPTSEFGFFFKFASECKLNNSGNNKTDTVWGHAWMIWCQFDVRRGDNIGPEAWIFWFTSLHTLFTCGYFNFESDHAKKYIWDNKTVFAHKCPPMTLQQQRVKINRTGHLITILMEFMLYDALQLNSNLIFFIIWPAVFNHYLLSLNYIWTEKHSKTAQLCYSNRERTKMWVTDI